MKPIATPDPIIAQAVKLFAERGYAETNLPSSDRIHRAPRFVRCFTCFPFIERFLEFWGFITVNPKPFADGKPIAIKANIQPLLKQTFAFDI